MVKCNRTVCNNVGIHRHNFNHQLYCSDCVYQILDFKANKDCFDIEQDEAWRLRRDDRQFEDE